MRTGLLTFFWLGLVGCGAVLGPNPRTLHYVDEELVHSRAVPSGAYGAYLRARVAMSSEPPQLEVAQREIERALRYDARDPHLWTTRAEIADLAGDHDTAMASVRKALSLRPGYDPAQRLLVRLEGGATASAVASAPLPAAEQPVQAP